mgnify:CR=1 FL=1
MPFFNYEAATFLGLILGSVYFSFKIFKKTSWLEGILSLYFLLQASHYYCWPRIYVDYFGPVSTERFHYLAISSIAIFLFSTIPILDLKERFAIKLPTIFWTIGLIDAFIMLGNFILGREMHGLLSNASQDGCFIACVLPFVFTLKRRISLIPFVIMSLAIILAKESTPIVALIIGIFLFLVSDLIQYYEIVVDSVLCSSLFLIIAMIVATFYVGPVRFLDSSGRYFIWTKLMTFWWNKVNIWIGAGGGTFYNYGPGVSWHNQGSKPDFGAFIWMHNDFLQVLFEQGIIGLALVLAVLGKMIKRAYNDPVLFTAITVFAFTATTQMPLRNFLTAFLGSFLVRSVYDQCHQERVEHELNFPRIKHTINN